jgi:S1-C subfamily serine protease
MLKFPCSACGKSLNAGPQFFGKMVKCPHCGQAFKIAVLAKPESADVPSQPSIPASPLRRSSKMPSAWAVISIIASAAIVMVGSFYALNSRHAETQEAFPEPVAAAPAPVLVQAVQDVPSVQVEPSAAVEAAEDFAAADGALVRTAAATEEPDSEVAESPAEDRLATAMQSVVLLQTDKHSLGSGFIVHDQSLVATNLHVVEGAVGVTATFPDGSRIRVNGFMAASPGHDLAILHLAKPAAVPPLKLAERPVRVGQDVFAIGSPKGLSFSVSKGVVSQNRQWNDLSRFLGKGLASFGYDADSRWIQTDAAITGGNSGGPLVLPSGEVLGLNTLSSPAEAGQNLNFAIDVSHLHSLLEAMSARHQSLAELPATRKIEEDRPARQEQAVGPTLAYWDSMAYVLGTFAAEYQQERINQGLFVVAKSTIDRPAGQKVGLDDPLFGKTKADRQRRISRWAAETGTPYNEALQMTFVELQDRVSEKQIRKTIQSHTAVYERRLDPGVLQAEKARQRQETGRRQANADNEAMKKRYEMSFSAAMKLDAIPTAGVEPVLVAFAADLATAYRREANACSRTQSLAAMADKGGSWADFTNALREMDRISAERVEMVEVAGIGLGKKLELGYGAAFGPILRFTPEQARLFNGRDVTK